MNNAERLMKERILEKLLVKGDISKKNHRQSYVNFDVYFI